MTGNKKTFQSLLLFSGVINLFRFYALFYLPKSESNFYEVAN